MKIEASTPEEYLAKLEEPRKSDVTALHHLIRETVPDLTPNTSFGMLGYGVYHYRYASGREGDWPIIALASQKNYITLYADVAVAQKYREQLPKADIGQSCIRFKKLADIDTDVLRAVLRETKQAHDKAAAAASGSKE